LVNEERKNNGITQLKMMAKEVVESPYDEGTSSKSPNRKIDLKPESRIPQRPNKNEG